MSEDEKQTEENHETVKAVLAQWKAGNICYMDFDGNIMSASTQNFIQQPADGILYDLNRLEECISEGVRWVNDFGMAKTVRVLKDRIATLEVELAKAKEQGNE